MLAPTVWATSWNTDLSKLSQPEGSLEGGDRRSQWQESAPGKTEQLLPSRSHLRGLASCTKGTAGQWAGCPGEESSDVTPQPGLGRTFPVVIFRSSEGVHRERQCREVSATGGNFSLSRPVVSNSDGSMSCSQHVVLGGMRC